MNKIHISIPLLIICLLCLSIPGHATGIGVFGSVTGDQYLKLFTGGGLVIDTNCAADRLFNYRLAVGGYKFILSKDESLAGPSNLDLMTKFSLLNTFGFGLVRKKSFRFWLGPQIGFHARYFRSTKSFFDRLLWGNGGSGPQAYYQYGPESMLGASAGLTFGFNFNFKSNITLSIELGGNYYILYGTNNVKMIIVDSTPIIMTNNNMIKMNFMEIFASISILYRISDSFIAGTSELK